MATDSNRTRVLSVVFSGLGKGEVLQVGSNEGNTKFCSIRTEVRHEVYRAVQQKYAKGPGKDEGHLQMYEAEVLLW